MVYGNKTSSSKHLAKLCQIAHLASQRIATPSQDNSAAKTPGVVMMVRMNMIMAKMLMKMLMIRKILEVSDVGDDEINKYEDPPPRQLRYKNTFKLSCCPGEISSDLYRFVQCDIKKCAFDSLKLEQNPQNCD